jgi:predicted transcriptional regulator
MDVIYARRSVTVQEVVDEIPDPPSYSAVRAMLRVLEEKGHVQHGAT